MKLLLTILAGIFFLGPFLAWAYLVALANSFANQAQNGLHPGIYFDPEFLMVAAIPWLIAMGCVFAASRLQ